MIKTAIIGGSGYGGGELLRLLLNHPETEVTQVTSRSHLGEYVYQVHPNLRKRTMLKFCDPDQIPVPDGDFHTTADTLFRLSGENRLTDR